MKRAELNKIYRKTRDLIAKKGNWIKGDYYYEDGKYCLLGALRKVSVGNPWDYGSDEELERVLLQCVREIHPKRFSDKKLGWPVDTTGFNDHERTTHKDVLKVLDCAIADTAPRPRKESA